MGITTNTDYLTTVDGLQLFYRSSAPDSPRAVVMLLHGLGEHVGRYDRLIDHLNQHQIAVCAVDHRGHGKSEGRRVFVRSYDDFMTDIAKFREQIMVELPELPLIVFGHSMGGNLALGHVLRYQRGVTGLALSGPAIIPGDDVNALTRTAASLIAKFAPGFSPQALDANAISRDPQVVEDYKNDPLVHHGKITAGLAAALFGEMDRFPQQFQYLSVPVLVQHGTIDRLTNIDGSKQLAEAVTDATVTEHYYDGLFHEIYNEPEQQQVMDDLTNWIAGLID